jgi:regulator of ribonuclease activity A
MSDPHALLPLLTADLCDARAEARVVMPALPWRDYGGRTAFAGKVRTVKVYEDNVRVRAALETPGDGAVLVVDGGGSLRCALVGGLLGELAVKNGWSGIVVFGCIRDGAELATMDLGIKAIATHPRKSERGLHGGASDVPVEFGGVRITPGDWLVADADGVVVLAAE